MHLTQGVMVRTFVRAAWRLCWRRSVVHRGV